MQNVYNKQDDLSKTISQGEDQLKNVASDAQRALKQGQEQLQKMIVQADKQLHENPWPIVAGVAVGCLFLGYFAGKSKN